MKQKTALVLGITDKVFLRKTSKKEIGHVFFYEIDKQLTNNDKVFLKTMSRKHWCVIFILKTKKGYHFISFKIFSCAEHMRIFADFMEHFKSDYNHNLSNKILRISQKGKSPAPQFEACIVNYSTNNLSTLEKDLHLSSIGHIKIYEKTKIIPDYLLYIIPFQTKTYAKLCIYKSKKRLK